MIAHMTQRNEVRGRVIGSMSIGIMERVRVLQGMSDTEYETQKKARALEARLVSLVIDPQLPQEMPRSVKIALLDHMWKEETEICFHYLAQARTAFDREGPYCYAKRLGLLIDNCAEDFAIEFMSYVNKVYPNTY